jgi:hypothetical protein
MSNNVRRAIRIDLLNDLPPVELELSRFATPAVEKQFIHLDQMPDGTWRLLFNVEGLEVKDIDSFVFNRYD